MRLTLGYRGVAGCRLVLACLLLGAGIAGSQTGCSSVKSPGSASHAALTLDGYSTAQIALMARTVFTDAGYTLSHVEQGRMFFDRPGTKADVIKYGGWGDENVVIRVKLDIQDMGDTKHLLRCDVFSVRDPGHEAFEYETKLMLLSTKKYRQLLEEIQSRLKAASAPASPAP